ncbi:MAG: hypothetical protein JNL74_04020 [Fibrobacteres bacterium]|nr:hypothetical protein [Fibrobacterota bacterium]
MRHYNNVPAFLFSMLLIACVPTFPINSNLTGEFQQGEYHRNYSITGKIENVRDSQLSNMDTIALSYSPSRFTDNTSASFYTTIDLVSPWRNSIISSLSFLLNGRGSGSADLSSKSWENESDRLRAVVRTASTPVSSLKLTFDGGIQSTGWRSPGINERRNGPFYSFGAEYSNRIDTGLVDSISASISDARTFIDEDRYINTSASAALEKHFKDKNLIKLNGFFNLKKNEQPFTITTGNIDYAFKTLWEKNGENYRHEFQLLTEGTSQSFEGNEANDRAITWRGFEYSPFYIRQRLRIKGNASYYSYNTEFVPQLTLPDRPGAAELIFASAKLGNEDRANINVSTKVAYAFSEIMLLSLSAQKSAFRYDYPFEYTNLLGRLEKNFDQRDIVYDNDSLSFRFPAVDTGTFTIARSTRILNYLSGKRSEQNRASTAYTFRLEHATSMYRMAGTVTRISLIVNDDSLYYPADFKPAGRFTRRRALYNISDLNFIPGFKQESDSAAIEINLAYNEEGDLSNNGERQFVRKRAAEEALLSFRLNKSFTFGLQIYATTSFSRYRLFTASPNVIIPEGQIDKAYRKIFRIPELLTAADLSANRDISAGALFVKRRTQLSLTVSSKTVDFNRTRVRDYIAIGFNGAVSF